MIVIKVELHSAITKKVTELARMYIANDGTGSSTFGNYKGQTLRKPLFTSALKHGKVEHYHRQKESVWQLIARMLSDMGYK